MRTFSLRAAPVSPIVRPVYTCGTARQFARTVIIVALIAAGWFACGVAQWLRHER